MLNVVNVAKFIMLYLDVGDVALKAMKMKMKNSNCDCCQKPIKVPIDISEYNGKYCSESCYIMDQD